MIKNVIFDYGNVICKTDIDALICSFAENEADFPVLKKAIGEDWAKVDAGYDYETYLKETLSRLPERLHVPCKRFFAEWFMRTPYIKGIEEVVSALKARGYKLFLLSNAPEYFYKNLHFFRIFDHPDTTNPICAFIGFCLKGLICVQKSACFSTTWLKTWRARKPRGLPHISFSAT